MKDIYFAPQLPGCLVQHIEGNLWDVTGELWRLSARMKTRLPRHVTEWHCLKGCVGSRDAVLLHPDTLLFLCSKHIIQKYFLEVEDEL